jgi:hypothetical protein
MTLNLNHHETIFVFDPTSGPELPNEIEFEGLQIDGCEYSGSNIGFDLQMNRRRLILLGSEGPKLNLLGIDFDLSSSAENQSGQI